MIVFDDDHSHTFLQCGKCRINLEGTPLPSVDTNYVVACFVGFFEAISEFPRVGDSPHSHRSLEGGSPQIVDRYTEI